MKRIASLVIAATFTSASYATTIPQLESNGENGLFSINSDTSLFGDFDNIYNFTDFIISDGAALSISSTDPLYIYSQQTITIDGSVIFSGSEISFIAPDFNFLNATIDAGGASLQLVVLGNESETTGSTGDTTNTSGATISNGSGSPILLNGDNTITQNTGSLSGDTSISLSPIVIDESLITPVPLPAALWLFAAGLSALGIVGRSRKLAAI